MHLLFGPLWLPLNGFLNSAFVSAFLSALAGAAFGVWGAQRVAARDLLRKQLEGTIAHANAMTVLATTISNAALNMKRQHIDKMAKEYFEQRETAIAFNDMLNRGETPSEHMTVDADLAHINPPSLPMDALKEVAFKEQSSSGKTIALVVTLDQIIGELSQVLSMRSQEVDRLKKLHREGVPLEIRMQVYFGLKTASGDVDAVYHDIMRAIRQYSNDVAFFAKELAEVTNSHATQVGKRLKSLTGERVKVYSADFSESEASGLMPPRENYAEWLAAFADPADT